MKIYIAGPMTGLPELNFPAFHAAAALFRSMGYEVVSPAELVPEPGIPWLECMRIDIAALIHCDAICMLRGWEKSKGARLENAIAEGLGMRVLLPAGNGFETPLPFTKEDA